MDIKEIEAFIAVARHGGVTRAAERLNRSQPAISRRIRLLEDQLGVPLIERVRGRAMLTEAGDVFLPHAEAVLATMKDGVEAVRALRDAEQGTIMLALVGTLASTTILAQLRDFRMSRPSIRVELRTANSREVSALVRRGEATFGLRYDEDPLRDLTSEAVATEAMIVVCAPEHRLAGQVVHNPKAFQGNRWVGFPSSKDKIDGQALLERQLIGGGLNDVDIVAIDSLTAQKRLVEAGFGLALMPESAVQEELRLGTLAMIDAVRLKVSVPVFMVYRERAYLSPAAQSLLDVIRGTRIRPSDAA